MSKHSLKKERKVRSIFYQFQNLKKIHRTFDEMTNKRLIKSDKLHSHRAHIALFYQLVAYLHR